MPMDYTFKTWTYDDYYDFYVEFNRIESYNEYCKKWLSHFGKIVTFTSKTNWTMSDIVDMKDYNRVKTNINLLLNAIDSSTNNLSISSQVNQVWNVEKANELEVRLQEYLKYIGEMQFPYNITSSTTITGNNLKLGGVS